MLDLVEQAEKADIEPKVQGVWRYGDSVGRVDPKPPFSAMKFSHRVNELEERVAHWEEQDPPRDADEAWHRVCDFYADMRTTWERAVEERLFRGVVQRFQREVKTQSLAQVTITPDLVQMIDAGMTRCSYFVHDAAAGTRTSLPTRTQMRDDVGQLRQFDQLRKRS
jgi:hypothetical protein